MRTTKLLTALATGALAVSLVAAHEGRVLDFAGDGSLEIGSPGDPRAAVEGHVYAPNENLTRELCLDAEITFGRSGKGASTDVVGVHIHEVTPGGDGNGPVIADFTPFYDAETRTVDGCVELESAPAVANVVIPGRTADEYYVNVHTRAFPKGAARANLD